MNNELFFWNILTPPLPPDYDIPPTIYSLLNSYVNFDNPNPVKISNLASAGRNMFFDFNYTLTDKITKEDFEVMILNHFLMRRIGYDTVTAFKIALCNKLNEILPKYNMLFNSMDGWDLFNDGETLTRTETSRSNSDSTGSSNISTTSRTSGRGDNISDRRFSNTPQNELSNVRDGKYVTEYNYDTDNSSTTTDSNDLTNTSTSARDLTTGEKTYTEHRNRDNHVEEYVKFSNEVNNVYTLIFKDLEPLFYGLV